MIFIRNFFKRSFAKFGVAIGGHNYGNVTINNGTNPELIENIDNSLQGIHGALQNLSTASELMIRDAVDASINAEIDNLAKLIQQNKPFTALQSFTDLYARVASTSQGKIRFRIMANIGICHYLIGDRKKASELLLEAYLYAPSEPKAISNKMLALLLQDQTKEAFEFATIELQKSPDNATLAGYLIQASKNIPEVLNPLDLIPNELHSTPQIFVGHILYLQHRGTLDEWMEIANKGEKLFPEDADLKYHSNLAAIESVFNSPAFQLSHKISDTQFSCLNNACNFFREIWRSIFNGEANLQPTDMINLSNLMLLYRFLNIYEESRVVINEAISKASENQKNLTEIAKLAIELSHLDLAEKAIKNINSTEIPDFLKLKIAEIKNDTKYLASLDISQIHDIPVNEKLYTQLILELAKIDENNLWYENERLESLFVLAGENVQALLFVARAASIQKIEDTQYNAYQKAISLITPKSNITCRLILGLEAYLRKDWPTVIDSLDGYIPLQINSPNLRYLAVAFSNVTPIRERALNFFNELPAELLNSPEIETLLGVLYFNQGNLELSEKHCMAAFSANSTNLFSLDVLLSIYNLQNQQSKTLDLLKDINPFVMVGDPISKIRLAQLLNVYGRYQDAASFGYHVLSKNLDNPQIIMAYMGLFFANEENFEIPHSNEVKKGFWVQLTDQNNEVFEYLYDDESITHLKVTSLKHPLVAKSIGLSINDSFEQERGFGPPTTWTVKQIKHKYLHALHDAMNTFETRFPDQAFWKITLPESGNVSVILDSIKELSEKENAKLNSYVETKLPLALLGTMLGKISSIAAAEKLLHRNLHIHTNTGATESLEYSLKMLETGKFTSLVFDTYTAWHAAVANLLPTLKDNFELIVPASVLMDIQTTIDDYSYGPKESFSIGWINGEFQKYESTEEDHQRMIDYIQSQKAKIEKYCKKEYVSLTNKPNELTSKILELGGTHFFDSAYLTNKQNTILISEDLFYREWARQALDVVNSTWLYPVLRYLNLKNLLTNAQLAEAIVHFSDWKHSHVFLNTSILIDVFNIDQTEKLHKLKSVLQFIGNQNEELMISHTFVCKKFLNEIWTLKEKEIIKVKKATDLALNSLLRFTSTKAPYILLMCIESDSELADYLTEWRENAGVTDEEMLEAHLQLH